MSEQNEIPFETLLKELERIIDALEKGDLPLESAIKEFERGMELVRKGNEILERAKKKLEFVTKTPDGKVEIREKEINL